MIKKSPVNLGGREQLNYAFNVCNGSESTISDCQTRLKLYFKTEIKSFMKEPEELHDQLKCLAREPSEISMSSDK